MGTPKFPRFKVKRKSEFENGDETSLDGVTDSEMDTNIPALPSVPLNCIPLSTMISRVVATSASQILGIIEV